MNLSPVRATDWAPATTSDPVVSSVEMGRAVTTTSTTSGDATVRVAGPETKPDAEAVIATPM